MHYALATHRIYPLLSQVALFVTVTASYGCTSALKIVSNPNADAHVVVLGGVVGQLAPGKAFIKELNSQKHDLGQVISAQTFDWQEIRDPDAGFQFFPLPGNSFNETRAKVLADELMKWREDTQSKGKAQHIYLVAGSGGDEIAKFACDHLPKGFFKRVVFLSAYNLPADSDLTQVKRACSGGVYNYFSTADRKWGIDSQAAGRIGFNDPDVWQLRWREQDSNKHKIYDNEGQCLNCYSTKFRDALLIPLFRSDGKLEDAALKRWKKGNSNGRP